MTCYVDGESEFSPWIWCLAFRPGITFTVVWPLNIENQSIDLHDEHAQDFSATSARFPDVQHTFMSAVGVTLRSKIELIFWVTRCSSCFTRTEAVYFSDMAGGIHIISCQCMRLLCIVKREDGGGGGFPAFRNRERDQNKGKLFPKKITSSNPVFSPGSSFKTPEKSM